MKVILSSKGQLVIPKNIRKKMGLHFGSQLTLELTNKNSLEISPLKQNIATFFGAGKNKATKPMSIEDMDKAIAQAVITNDRR